MGVCWQLVGQEHFPALWDLSSGVRLPFPDVHNGTIRSVEFSKDGKTMVTASGDNTLILWDVTGPEPRRRGPPLIGHRGAVLQTAFSPDGKFLASGSEDRSVLLWDTATRSQIGPPLLRHLDFVRALSFSGDGKQLFRVVTLATRRYGTLTLKSGDGNAGNVRIAT